MLPDMLVGLFTGKTKSINLKDNMMPIASIVTGMFVKNPILKMILIGMGGLNLLNKAGHETLDDFNLSTHLQMQYWPRTTRCVRLLLKTMKQANGKQ